MSIDKEGGGYPEVDFRRRTTKVNVAIVVGVVVFFLFCAGLIWWLASRTP